MPQGRVVVFWGAGVWAWGGGVVVVVASVGVGVGVGVGRSGTASGVGCGASVGSAGWVALACVSRRRLRPPVPPQRHDCPQGCGGAARGWCGGAARG